jgi:arylsulfatase A-like enzyme
VSNVGQWVGAVAIVVGTVVVGLGLTQRFGDEPAPTPTPTPVPSPTPEAETRKPGTRTVFTEDAGPVATREAGPDLLFITWDTARADHTSLHGYPRDTTPFLLELAGESVVFDRFIVPMSTTLPSHITMFTGTLPEEHGVKSNMTISGERFVPPEALAPLATHLKSRGWSTAAFVSSAPLKIFSGIGEGFVHFDQPRGHDRTADTTVNRVARWLEDAPLDQPVFLWVHLFDPHWPWEPPASHAEILPADDVLAEVIADGAFLGDLGPKRTRLTTQRLVAYDGEMRFTDDETRRLVTMWSDKRGLDNTVLVVAGDHGEGLGEHDHLEHGLVWDEQLHAPLLMRVPGVTARRFANPIGGNDLLPTLFGLADLPETDAFRGQWTGSDVLADDFVMRPVFSRLSGRHVTRLKKKASFALTGKRWKLLADEDGRTALYDLDADPSELEDVSSAHPAVVSRLVDVGVAQLEAQYARAAALGTGKTEKAPPEALEELRKLGYVE